MGFFQKNDIFCIAEDLLHLLSELRIVMCKADDTADAIALHGIAADLDIGNVVMHKADNHTIMVFVCDLFNFL